MFDLEDLIPQKAVKVVFLIGMGGMATPPRLWTQSTAHCIGIPLTFPLSNPYPENQYMPLHSPVFQALKDWETGFCGDVFEGIA